MTQNREYIAIIDLDKTLLTVNSGKIFVLSAYKKGHLSIYNLVKAIILSIMYKLWPKSAIKITELMVKWLKGVPENTVEELAKQVVKQELVHTLRPSIIQEIEKHKKQNAHIVILSAALPYICKPIADFLKLDGIICSAMETVQGIFTGKPKGKICMGQEKETRIRQYCLNNSYNLQTAHCYGDSYSDRFVLEVSGNPICVAPDKKLKKLAETKNWLVMW